jgi:hypothetical protein
VVGNAGILVDQINLDALCARIQQIMTDRYLREQLKVQGFARSRLFCWETSAQ